MDFGDQYQFPVAQQQFHQSFMPVPPPLTPSNSHSAPSEDYNASPPAAFDALPADQYSAFDYSQGFAANAPFPGRTGPPTPPNQPGFNQHSNLAQQHSQQGIHTHQQHHVPQSHQQQAQQTPPLPAGTAVTQGPAQFNSDALAMSKQDDFFDNQGPGSDDADPSLSAHAQSRRKAQNRAAQRAFRERKEKRVKDLETKLAELEAAQEQSSVENERLKADLQKMLTENEILRATSRAGDHSNHGSRSPESMATGPMGFKPQNFYDNVLENHQNKAPSHRVVTSDNGERLLAAGATWDFIINHELYQKGMVDVGFVSDRIKGLAKCDGQGPVFSENAILEAIHLSVASGSDDLL